MAALLSIALRLLVPSAHAVRLDTPSTNPAVNAMWAQICTILPYCSAGAAAPALIGAKILSFVLSLIIIVAICVIIYAGIRIIMTGVDEGGMDDAKKAIKYALLGIVLAVLGQTIIGYIQQVVLVEALR
jgi:hypothetical protein